MLKMRSQVLPIFLARLREAGLAPGDLVPGLELGVAPESEAEVTIPLAAFQTLCDAVAARVGDDFLGLHTAEALPRGTYGLVEFVFRTAPTCRDALTQLVRYVPLMNNLLTFTVTESGGKARVVARIEGEPLCLGRQANEFIVAIFLKVGREIAGTAWAPERVFFPHPAPANVDELERYLGTSQIAFDAEVLGTELASAVLDARIPAADVALHSFLDRQASERVAAAPPTDELGIVREKIRISLQSGEPSIERVAVLLNVSVRSLQRKLTTAATTFRALTDDVRYALARVYLEDHRRPLTEVAFLLGYSDLRAFVRAHKRWSGKTPGASRRGPP